MPETLDLGSIIGPSAFKDWCSRQDPVLDSDEPASWVAFLAAIKGATGETGAPGADGLTESQVDARVAAGITGKQDTLTFDAAPTAASTNPVTSAGVKTALDAKQGTLTFDTEPTTDSTNPVTSGGLKVALDALAIGDTGWVAMTMNAAIVSAGTIYYRVKSGVLYLAGTVTVLNTQSVYLTSSAIPAEYRPASNYGGWPRIHANVDILRVVDICLENGVIRKGGIADYYSNVVLSSSATVTITFVQNSWVI